MSNSKSLKSNSELDEDLDLLEATLEDTLNGLEEGTLLSQAADVPHLQAYQALKKRRQRFYQTNPKPKENYHHGDLATALIDAAIEMIEEKGAASLSLRGIARSAGVSQAAPYRHFKDKDALITAVAVKGFTLLLYELWDGLHDSLSPWEQILALSQGYLKFTQEHTAYFKVMFGPEINSSDPDFQASQQEAITLFIDAILAGQEIQTFRDDSPADIQALAIWSLLHGFSSLTIYEQIQIEGLSITAPNILVNALMCLLYQGTQPQRS